MEGRDGLGMGLRHGLEDGLGLRHGLEAWGREGWLGLRHGERGMARLKPWKRRVARLEQWEGWPGLNNGKKRYSVRLENKSQKTQKIDHFRAERGHAHFLFSF